MKNLFRLALVALVFLTSACTSEARPQTPVPILLDDGVTQHRLMVEIADSPGERRQGLQKRTYLAADHGMLFIFNREQRVSFWMKDTPLSLDLLFFNTKGTLLDVYPNAVPNSRKPMRPVERVRYVLEIGAGAAAQMNIKPGARLILNP